MAKYKYYAVYIVIVVEMSKTTIEIDEGLLSRFYNLKSDKLKLKLNEALNKGFELYLTEQENKK